FVIHIIKLIFSFILPRTIALSQEVYWVHYRLKAKLKVPRPKSAKQEPNADQRFKKTSPQPC
ncbi:hypothetical protein QUA13_26935, partial [Microcoleus sp. S28C3]